jgi:hypothetical protein
MTCSIRPKRLPTDFVPGFRNIMEFAGIWKKRSRVYATSSYYGSNRARAAHITGAWPWKSPVFLGRAR